MTNTPIHPLSDEEVAEMESDLSHDCAAAMCSTLRQKVHGTYRRLLATIRQKEEQMASLRVRVYNARVREGSADHSTACTIWGDDGQGGTPEKFPDLTCNCGALVNNANQTIASLRDQITALQGERDEARAAEGVARNLAHMAHSNLGGIKEENARLTRELSEARGRVDKITEQRNSSLASVIALTEMVDKSQALVDSYRDMHDSLTAEIESLREQRIDDEGIEFASRTAADILTQRERDKRWGDDVFEAVTNVVASAIREHRGGTG